jgi:CDGSH-type Zn-finger protein/uncharacterized Fe-S cluster protein YjdI
MKQKTIKYSGEKIDVYFAVDRCTHVADCLRGAPEVFDVNRRPWIMADNGDPDLVSEVIMTCPTGALHFKRKDGGDPEPIPSENVIIIGRNGPYYVKGDIEIVDHDNSLVLADTRIALCRCGGSTIMPFCDGSHFTTLFQDRLLFPGNLNTGILTRGKIIIYPKKDSALNIHGPMEILAPSGEYFFRGEQAKLCRCGSSRHMPFCDGSHKEVGFVSQDKFI